MTPGDKWAISEVESTFYETYVALLWHIQFRAVCYLNSTKGAVKWAARGQGGSAVSQTTRLLHLYRDVCQIVLMDSDHLSLESDSWRVAVEIAIMNVWVFVQGDFCNSFLRSGSSLNAAI